MVLEIAQIDVKPGMEAEFEAGVARHLQSAVDDFLTEVAA